MPWWERGRLRPLRSRSQVNGRNASTESCSQWSSSGHAPSTSTPVTTPMTASASSRSSSRSTCPSTPAGSLPVPCSASTICSRPGRDYPCRCAFHRRTGSWQLAPSPMGWLADSTCSGTRHSASSRTSRSPGARPTLRWWPPSSSWLLAFSDTRSIIEFSTTPHRSRPRCLC